MLYFGSKLTVSPEYEKEQTVGGRCRDLYRQLIVGILGTGFGIVSSFTALKSAESAGIERVGDGIESAMLFTTVSLIGSTIGLVLLAAGAIASYRRSRKQQTYTE